MSRVFFCTAVLCVRPLARFSIQGLDKKETVAKHGKDQVMIWRRSYTTPPPLLADDRYVVTVFVCPTRARTRQSPRHKSDVYSGDKKVLGISARVLAPPLQECFFLTRVPVCAHSNCFPFLSLVPT